VLESSSFEDDVLRYHYTYHMPPSAIDKVLKLPPGTSRLVVVEDWHSDREHSARVRR